MEIHQLRYFSKVADLGSFTRAAEACFVAQPSLSQQIIKLEAELGTPLFERLARRVILTDAGRRLRPIAEQILRLVDEVKERVDGDAEAGRVAVGSPPTVVPYFLTGVLGTFAQSYPRAQVELVEDVTSAIVRKLHDCEVDLAILPAPHRRRRLRRRAPLRGRVVPAPAHRPPPRPAAHGSRSRTSRRSRSSSSTTPTA